jgi:hypothetical protein
MLPQLPKGVDLSSLGKKDPIAIKVNPGDRVMVLLPRQSSQQEVSQITEYLVKWAPETQFIVLAGPESITVIPGPPSEDKEPQGPDASCYSDRPEQCAYHKS